MGFFDVIAAALPWSDAEAEAVKGGASTESTPANDTEGGKEEEGDAKVCSHSLCSVIVLLWE